MYKQRGITLMELMVVMVVVAILGSIAIPSYRQYMVRTNRTSAKVALQQAAQSLERCFTRYNAYDGVAATAAGDAACIFNAANTPDNTYRITYNYPTSIRFTITATPQGKQADDTKCGNFTLDETGTQAVTGTAGRSECWGK